jgi:hypothetical protein
MYGNAMYEVARQRVAEQQRDARQARQAREQRAAVRAGRRAKNAKKEARETIATPVIPDFAHEMFDEARDAVPAPRQEARRGRHAGTSH